jgi:Family of unknown function (DUF6221)
VDPIAFGQARLDEDEQQTRHLLCRAQNVSLELEEPKLLGRHTPGWDSWGDVEKLCERALRDVESGRRILARHTECAQRGTGPCWEFPGVGDLCRELADLLYRWTDHPDYDPRWKPEL